ncbi:hypothetical protein [Planctobacterium marinum]|uniref:hypothetical protein n=1 Tax=Planctobacterium marinum TaxID=1631968 RepID=UPI001E37FEAD|nr:hypothetical protein [Planctobacterium marinum]MCC2607987.1 hypothetical protein [Planctobacterium marinum]
MKNIEQKMTELDSEAIDEICGAAGPWAVAGAIFLYGSMIDAAMSFGTALGNGFYDATH